MRIRLRLFLLMTAMMSLTLAVTVILLTLLQREHRSQQEQRSVQLIQQLVDRAALEALLASDRLSLVSQLKFLRERYPGIESLKLTWRQRGRVQDLMIGSDTSTQGARRRHLERATIMVEDPKAAGDFVRVVLLLDPQRLKAAAVDSLSRLFRTTFGVLACLLLAGLFLAHITSKAFTRPLDMLNVGAAAISKGKLGIKLPEHAGGEFGTLISNFNNMSRELETMEEMKRDFLACVTHELKSPLSALGSVYNVLDVHIKDTSGPVKRGYLEQYIEHSRRHLSRLLGLVENLLDSAQITNGAFTCALRPVALSPLLKDAILTHKPFALANKVRLTLDDNSSGARVLADPDRLHQVFANLISNALKFTPPGGTICLAAAVLNEGSGGVRISLSDTGHGIDEADIPRLFDKFQQAKNVDFRNPKTPKGTGLGLFIAQTIVGQHGGQISAASELGKGAVFSFELKSAR